MTLWIDGREREYFPYKRSECADCGSQTFKQSKLTGHWYCNGCNKNFEDEKPWFYMIHCSTHGRQLQFDPSYCCQDCEDDDFTHQNHTYGSVAYHATPTIVPLTEISSSNDPGPAR